MQKKCQPPSPTSVPKFLHPGCPDIPSGGTMVRAALSASWLLLHSDAKSLCNQLADLTVSCGKQHLSPGCYTALYEALVLTDECGSRGRCVWTVLKQPLRPMIGWIMLSGFIRSLGDGSLGSRTPWSVTCSLFPISVKLESIPEPFSASKSNLFHFPQNLPPRCAFSLPLPVAVARSSSGVQG